MLTGYSLSYQPQSLQQYAAERFQAHPQSPPVACLGRGQTAFPPRGINNVYALRHDILPEAVFLEAQIAIAFEYQPVAVYLHDAVHHVVTLAHLCHDDIARLQTCI